MRSDGSSVPSLGRRLACRLRFGLRHALVERVEVEDRGERYVFRCEEYGEVFRAMTLFIKEQGTVDWIRSEVQAGDVFYDVGANTGLYSLLAARRVGSDGLVYSFEPHIPTARSLLENVAANGMGDRINVLTCALHDRDGLFAFNYRGAGPGGSGSQLDEVRDDTEATYAPVFSETKVGFTLDSLVQRFEVRPPDLVKIDVDGNELLILAGMEALLSGPQRPRAVQVEINKRHRDRLLAYMQEHEFELAERHYTLSGKRLLKRGADPDTIPHNAIFRPR